jgi:hypothetical protein
MTAGRAPVVDHERPERLLSCATVTLPTGASGSGSNAAQKGQEGPAKSRIPL